MNLNSLDDNETVLARCGRAGRTGVDWNRWQNETLYIQKDNEGNVTCPSLRSRQWAEAGRTDLENIDFTDARYAGIIMVEDYYLQIMDLISIRKP